MSSKKHTSGFSKKSAKKSPAVLKRRPTAPKEWNAYLTDGDRFKISKEEELRKKQLLLSKHNAFVDNNPQVNLKGARKDSKLFEAPSHSFPDNTTTNEVNALDLLESDNESAHQATPGVMRKRKHTSSSTKKPQKKIDERRGLADSKGMGATAKRLAFGRHETPSEKPKQYKETSPREEMRVDALGSGESVTSSTTTGRGLGQGQYRSSASPSKQSFAGRSPRMPSSSRQTALFSPSTASARTAAASSSTPENEKERAKEKDHDLVYVADEVRSLFGELKYYEELSGRRSILDTREELEQMLKDEALLDPQEHKPVMRYLVNLVCQSLTYLLKSEVDLQDQHKHYEQLRAQYETLHTLLGPDSAAVPRVSDLEDFAATSSASTYTTYAAMSHKSTAAVGTSTPSFDFEASASSSNYYSATTAASTPGIGYREDDLYPSALKRDPEYARLVSQASSATPIAAMAIAAAAATRTSCVPTTEMEGREVKEGEEPSSAMRRLAQQYAQDDLYPVHGDAEDYAQQHCKEQQSTTPMITAKTSSTPARFQERLQQQQQHSHQQPPSRDMKAAGLAEQRSPSMAVSTPVRQFASSGKHNPYNSVNSTCSTPPVGRLLKKFAQGLPSTEASHNERSAHSTEALMTHIYPHITTPAPYTDAFAAYLPGTRRAVADAPFSAAAVGDDASMSMDVTSTPRSGVSRLPSAHKGHEEVVSSGLSFAPDFSRLDALMAQSRSIAAAPTPLLQQQQQQQHSSAQGAAHGGEYSTICRLTENFASRGGRTPADESMLSASTSACAAANLSALDTSSLSAYKMHQYQEEQHFQQLQRMRASEDSSSVPPPPPPAPHLMHTSSNITSNDNGDLFASMPGTSASDWLFGAYAQVTKPSASTGRNAVTPEGVAYSFGASAPAPAPGVLSTPPRQVTAAPAKTVAPLPQSLVHNAAKTTRTTPATTDLYHQQGSAASTTSSSAGTVSAGGMHLTGPSSRLLTRRDSPDSVGDATVDRLAQQFSSALEVGDAGLPTPPPRAAVPEYLLSQLKQWAGEESPQQQQYASEGRTPELHGASSVHTTQVRKVHVAQQQQQQHMVSKQSIVSVRRTSATPPGIKQQHQQARTGLFSSSHSHHQEGPSVIHPNTLQPSPQAAPVHPFSHKQVPVPVQFLRKGDARSPSHSNASTPMSVLQPLPLSGRVFDARQGSF